MAQRYEDFDAEQARLCVLKELARQTDHRANEAVLERVLDSFGYRRSREWIRTQLRKLEELGAISVTEIGSVMVAELKQAGLDHVERRGVIEGVGRSRPGG